MRIAMIGGGYVGLVSGACFAEFGTEVTVVEADPRQARRAARGPHADLRTGPRTAGGRERRRRTAVLHRRPGRRRSPGAEAVFIAVGTPDPPRRRPRRPDLCLCRRRAGGARADRLCRDRHQIDRPRRHRPPHRTRSSAPRGPTWNSTSPPTRIPARGQRDRRLHAPRPGRRSAPKANARARCCAGSIARCI